jgi:hypothetical protein
VNYEFIPYIVMLYLLIRIGIFYGRKIPLIFIGLLVIGRLTLQEALGPSGFSIYVIVLAIILALIDRFKSVRWHSM